MLGNAVFSSLPNRSNPAIPFLIGVIGLCLFISLVWMRDVFHVHQGTCFGLRYGYPETALIGFCTTLLLDSARLFRDRRNSK